MKIDESKIETNPTMVFYLEMDENPNFEVEKAANTERVVFEKLDRPLSVETYRKHYYNVGFPFQWLDRLVMADDELSEKINAPNIDIFVFKIDGEDAGYAEFQKEEAFTEIVYFGLYENFIGKGLGKLCLQWVINQAWSYNPEWIQLNTCGLDHENALLVYQSQGFDLVETKIEDRKVLIN